MSTAISGVTDTPSVSSLPATPGSNQTYPSLTSSQSIANAKAAGASSTVAAGSDSSTSTLGKTAFLQLLVQEMTNQDPLQPADDTQFIAQLAQFSSLEQMQNINTTLTSLVGKNQISEATAMLGMDVTAVDSASGATVTGVGDQVIVSTTTDTSGTTTQTVQIDISGTPTNVGDVTTVGPGASALSSTSTTTATTTSTGGGSTASASSSNLPGALV